MAKTISILGCGWLGTAVAKRLILSGYTIKASAATAEHVTSLKNEGFNAFRVLVHPGYLQVDNADFFNADALIIAIPPKRIEHIEDVFPAQISRIMEKVKEHHINRVLFISSTSVYPSVNTEVKEEDALEPQKSSGIALIRSERMLMDQTVFATTVLRFGGLIGGSRNPARFLKGRHAIPGDTPVNLIHQEDCVNIIRNIIQKDIWNEVFNACCPEHPTRREFYSRAAEVSGLPVPDFTTEAQAYKIVNSDKLIQKLDYRFVYKSPVDYLNSIQ